jgi:hypothetical protein
LISVIIGDDRLKRVCQLSNGQQIGPAALLPRLSDADIEVLVFDTPFFSVAASPRRSFTGAVRRAVQLHDRHCQHESGCDEPIDRCDVDHLREWSRGGETSVTNGRLHCRYHNRIAQQHHHPPPRIPLPDGTWTYPARRESA